MADPVTFIPLTIANLPVLPTTVTAPPAVALVLVRFEILDPAPKLQLSKDNAAPVVMFVVKLSIDTTPEQDFIYNIIVLVIPPEALKPLIVRPLIFFKEVPIEFSVTV